MSQFFANFQLGVHNQSGLNPTEKKTNLGETGKEGHFNFCLLHSDQIQREEQEREAKFDFGKKKLVGHNEESLGSKIQRGNWVKATTIELCDFTSSLMNVLVLYNRN